jgi:hypothetical protein
VDEQNDYKNFSKSRLLNNISKKFNTTTIGSLAIIEDNFGFLWGHGLSYNELSEDQKDWREAWGEVRTKILDLGNSNLRASQSEIGQYTLTWNRYVTNFYVKGAEE